MIFKIIMNQNIFGHIALANFQASTLTTCIFFCFIVVLLLLTILVYIEHKVGIHFILWEIFDVAP